MRRAILLLTLASACASVPRQDWLGANASVFHRDGTRWQGELLAVSADSVVFFSGDTLRVAALGDLHGIRIDRGRGGPQGPLVRHALFGVVSATAMGAACAAAEASDCVGVFIGFFAASMFVGLIGAAEAYNLRNIELERPQAADVRPWTRYPQGMPPGVVPVPFPAERP